MATRRIWAARHAASTAARVARERTGVRGGGTCSGFAAARREQNNLLACRNSRCTGPGESPAVTEVLAVDPDDSRVLVGGESFHELGSLDISLVSERREARDTDPVLRCEQAQLERKVPALGDDPQGSRTELVGAEIEVGGRVVHAEAVRAEHDRARRANALHDGGLSRLAGGSISPSPAVIATMARAPAASESSIAASNAAAGSEMTTSSGAPGSSASDRYASEPRISPPLRLTSQTSRR